MKIRMGFVSNSSSSSFIISAKKDKFLKDVSLILTVDLNKFVEKKITTLKQLEDHQKEYDHDARSYEQMKNEILEGNTIFIGSFTDEDSDEPLESYLCHNGLPPMDNIIIIESEGGY